MKRLPVLFLPVLLFFSLVTYGGLSAQTNNGGADDEKKSEIIEEATFTTLGGEKVAVEDFKGKVVLVDFWETWCGPCVKSFPTIQDLVEEYPDDFAVLAVTPGFNDTKEDVEKFIKENDYDFKYVMDDNAQVTRALGIRAIPHKVVIDADGNYVKTIVGSEGKEKDYKKTKELIEKHKKAE